jgi:Protein of unknown function (DUF559)
MAPHWPFVGTEALAAGLLTNHGLRTSYTAVHRNVYVPRGVTLTAVDKAVAAWLWSRREGVVAGMSAAALHGARWVDADLPAEINRSSRDKVSGIVLHSDALADEEICPLRGMKVTTAARTAYDIGRSGGEETVVVRLDALRQATRLDIADVLDIADRHRGARGTVLLRRALLLSDEGAESPQETRTRLLLMASGLPRPLTQVRVFDHFGSFVARVDIGWPQYQVAVEFDGAHHWTDPRQRSRDIDRIAELNASGWIVIRVSAELLRDRPTVILRRVRAALRERGLVVDEIA